MGRYDDIMNLGRPEPIRERMSLESRGAQFAPFAALTGHDEALLETARTTSVFREPGEHDLKEMSAKLSFMMMRNINMMVEITYFVPDERKSGGKYLTMRGEIRRIDEYDKRLILKDSTSISLNMITSLRILDNHEL
ncbi:MAG: hypothetical protein K2F70_02800 [Muribaculaceae bacterium]|nr:hypothetical protein [Muribaculaceae bacterium]